jgi:tRNA 2-thiocytidine biosynthesis protein TtcA
MIPPVNHSRLQTLESRIARRIGEAIAEWGLIEEGDRILVGISGGKDSYTLLHFLMRLRERAPVRFELLAFHLDQGHPGFPVERIREHLERTGCPYQIARQDTYSLVKERVPEGETTCALCSRYRRGILYNEAAARGCTKIALGHHRDDAIETLLLNLLYSGQLKAMPARLQSDDGRNTVIRPLIYVAEEDIREFAEAMAFPVVPCTLCTATERDQVARLLEELSARNPKVRGNVLAAMRKVVPGHLLDQRLLEALPERARAPAGPRGALPEGESGRSTARAGAPSLPLKGRGSAASS